MSRYDKFEKRGKCLHGHCSKMSNSAWTDLNKDNSILKLHDMCANKNCNCQKMLTFTPKQYQLEGGSIKQNLKKYLKEQKRHGIVFLNQH